MIEIAVSLLSHTFLLPQLQISHETWVALNWIGFVLGCSTILPRCCLALDVIVVRMKFLVSRAPLTESGCFADGGSFYKS